MDIEISLYQAGIYALQMLIAVLLAVPTAWNREANTRIVGLRTFPLVSLGACGYVMVGLAFIPADAPEVMARIMQGLITGIGFVGGGAILKGKDHVSGTASAASIWITGAMGAAVGFEMWTLALMLSVFNFGVIWVMSRLKKDITTEVEDGEAED